MNIKQLRIVGFKSFCNETEISFHRGLNAIVGPNGCGKSNISDALKWIMGEQNVRQLRGDRLEDMIFAGSRDNKPLGMAEVTMIVENNGGGLPPQYAEMVELEVTRRVFRSGESEYFINKTPCLLKDIREIFMDTGLNPRAYSIIEQGSIMEIVNSSPQELRRMLEEAAGITKYRERKAATLRKLDATRDNLLRVSDIILEVQKQVQTSRRQASEARKYIVFQKELARMEGALYWRQYEEMNRRQEAAAARHAALSGKVEGQRNRMAVLEARMEEGRVNLLGLEKELAGVQESFYQASGRLEVAGNQIRNLEERAAELGRAGEKAVADRGRAETDRGQAGRALEETRAALASVSAALERTRPELEELRRREADFEGELEARRKARDGRRQELARASAEKVALLESAAAAEARLAGVGKFIEDYAAEASRLRETEAAMTAGRATAGRDLAGAEAELASVLGKLEKARAEGLRVEEQLRGKARSVEEAVRRLTEREGRLGYLVEMRRRGDDLQEGARRLYNLAAGNGHGGEDFVGVLGHLIKVDRKYRRAIEAALAERLEAVLVKGEERALELAAKLKDDGVGGATVVPYGELRTNGSGSAGVEGSLGPAAGFVRSENGCDPLVKTLLDGVYLAADLPTAMELRRRAGRPVTLCTLDGDVVHAWGGVAVGARESSRGVLEVAEEAEKLEVEVGEARRSLEALEREAALLRDDSGKAKAAAEALEREKIEAERTLAVLKAEAERLGREAAEAARRREAVEKELEERRLERERDERELARSREGLEELAARERKLAAELEAREKESQDTEGMRAGLRNRISELEVARAADMEKQRSLGEAVRRLEAEADTLGRRLEELASLSADIERRLGETGTAIEEQHALVEELKGRSGTAGAEMDRLQGSHRALSAETAGLGEELRELRRAWEGSAGDLSEVSVEMAETRARLEETAARALAETGFAMTPDAPEELGDWLARPTEEVAARSQRLKARMARIGPVNMAALDETAKLQERLDFLTGQKADLEEAVGALQEAIRKINRTSREKFAETFEAVASKFSETFRLLFNGGEARLEMEPEVDVLEAGLHILAQPPGKKMTKLNLLSGGEKAMTAIALLFALFAVRPAPFCLMDEVDAPLDEANVERFIKLINATIMGSQIVLITHNKRTMEMADNLVGVTMESPGVSKLVSVRLDSDN